MSEQITWVLPRVSTAGMCRTMARFWAMRFMPMARTMVTTAVSPSGIAATPKLMAIMNISKGGVCCKSPMAKITPQMRTAPRPSTRPVCFSFSCKGVWGALSSSSMWAMCPTAVSIPVAVTMPAPAPFAMPVEANTMFFRSASGQSLGHKSSAFFSTGADSPVSADSSARSSTLLIRRKSAGTRSPAFKTTKSPGTSSVLSTVWRFPPRTTLARGEDSFFSASMALSARSSCTVPITAFTTTMARMIMESTNSPSPRSRETP